MPSLNPALIPANLTPASFCDFGDVVAHFGDVKRHDLRGAFVHGGQPAAGPAMWINRLKAHAGALVVIDQIERHPFAAQTFIPLKPARFLVVVALSDVRGQPDLTTLRAFVTDGAQGVSYRPCVWHFALTSLDRDSDVVVVLAATGNRPDTEISHVDPAPMVVTAGLAAS